MADASNRASAAPVYVAVAAFLGVAYFGAVLVATGGAPGRALGGTAMAIVPAVLMAFATFRAGRRVRWFDGGKARLALVHVALGLGYSALWNGATLAAFAAEHWLTAETAPFVVRADRLSFGLFTGLVLYGCVAGVAFGLETRVRLREEQARAARAETLRVRAELAALRARLDPHFLFNTLHTVLGLVRRDPGLAEEALQDLGDVLRYALSVHGGQEHVALRQELELVGRYLAIERVRLGDRLRVEERVAPAALDCRLPAFSLQPIVENAIRYAVACRAQGGRVRIEAGRDAGGLSVTISDDGAGAPAEDAGTGLGLSLVRQRLEAGFGPAAQLHTERTDAGFVVRLRVPQEPAGDP